jgi:hypothetical protein
MWEQMEAGCHRTVTERAVYPESGGQSGGRSGLDISHKRDFLFQAISSI